jgi:hypothetical protein
MPVTEMYWMVWMSRSTWVSFITDKRLINVINRRDRKYKIKSSFYQKHQKKVLFQMKKYDIWNGSDAHIDFVVLSAFIVLTFLLGKHNNSSELKIKHRLTINIYFVDTLVVEMTQFIVLFSGFHQHVMFQRWCSRIGKIENSCKPVCYENILFLINLSFNYSKVKKGFSLD